MTAFNITYDLTQPGRNYEGLFEAIKSTGKYWHYLDSTWIVLTQETAIQLWNRLAKKIDRNDSVLVIEVRNNVSGWMPKDAWAWISANVPR